MIQTLPHGIKYEGEVRLAFVNEEGLLHGLPLNEEASRLWRATLGDGPFWYDPEIVGAIAILVDDRVSIVEGGSS